MAGWWEGLSYRGSARDAEERARATKESAASTAVRAVEEYKDFDDFMNDASKVGKDAYFFGFADCKNMVAQAYPALDLSCISASREGESIVEEEEEVARERIVEEANVHEEVVEALDPSNYN